MYSLKEQLKQSDKFQKLNKLQTNSAITMQKSLGSLFDTLADMPKK